MGKKKVKEHEEFNEDSQNQPMTETRKKIHELYEEHEYNSIKQNESRARSITVGTAFGGIVEINMRADIGTVYANLQPTEAIEIIEQLAAGVGVEIAMRPKKNFASWRGWEEVIEQRVSIENLSFKGAAAWQIGPRREVQRAREEEEEFQELEKILKNSKRIGERFKRIEEGYMETKESHSNIPGEKKPKELQEESEKNA